MHVPAYRLGKTFKNCCCAFEVMKRRLCLPFCLSFTSTSNIYNIDNNTINKGYIYDGNVIRLSLVLISAFCISLV